ncbi:MAG TPA: hypothetical protein PK156_34145 [Polyangium sp.]|nr:hypothetical protein [Polyangium sp.]
MNTRLLAGIIAVTTSALLAIGCGSTAEITESEEVWAPGNDLTESEPVLGAEYLESEAPYFERKVETELMESEGPW